MVSNLGDAAAEAAEFSLPERIDVTAAGELREWFLGLSGDATLDASNVEIVTTAGLQVMMAGRDWVAKKGNAVALVSPTRDFMNCIAVLGTDLDRLTTPLSVKGGA